MARADLARCVFGNPLRPIAFAPAWRPPAAVYETRDVGRLLILADSLEEVGHDDPHVRADC